VSQNFTVTVATSPARLADISTRAQVGSGDNVLIGGFIIQGSASKRVLVRAIGPSLIPFGVANALMDPTLELRDMNGALLVSNDNWTTAANKQDITDTGRAPGASREAAVLTTLAPGRYTAIVRGVGATSGVALVEVYAKWRRHRKQRHDRRDNSYGAKNHYCACVGADAYAIWGGKRAE